LQYSNSSDEKRSLQANEKMNCDPLLEFIIVIESLFCALWKEKLREKLQREEIEVAR
jgi:hypothetical protein